MADDIVTRLRDYSARGAVFATNDMCWEAADEIERLRRWKWEATTVIERWEAVFDMVKPRPADLGRSKAAIVADEIERLQAAGDEMADAATRQQWSRLDVAVAAWQEARRG